MMLGVITYEYYWAEDNTPVDFSELSPGTYTVRNLDPDITVKASGNIVMKIPVTSIRRGR